MFFGRDRIIDRGVQDLQRLRPDLVAAGAARLGFDHARDLDRGLLGQLLEGLERGLVALAAEEHALRDPGAVPQLQELDLARGAVRVDPTLEFDGFSDLILQIRDERAHVAQK